MWDKIALKIFAISVVLAMVGSGIVHESPFNATGGTITCDKFIDANGRVYYDWIPAIKLFL